MAAPGVLAMFALVVVVSHVCENGNPSLPFFATFHFLVMPGRGVLVARWSYLPGGGCRSSTMSAKIEIPAHPSTFFFGNGGSTGSLCIFLKKSAV
jgi:hypothetical protein